MPASARLHSAKADIAKAVEPAKLDGLLAEARADGSFFKLLGDCQLVAAAFRIASEDDDRDMISAENAGKLLKRWRRNSGRACLRAAALGAFVDAFELLHGFFAHGS